MKSTRNVVYKIGLLFAVIASVLCFGIFTVSSAGFSQYAKAVAKPDHFVGPEITITKNYENYSLNDIISTTKTTGGDAVKGVKLPLVTSGSELTVEAKSATGKKITVYSDAEVAADLGGAYLLSPELYVGNYYVTYSATLNNVKTSKKLAVSFDSQRIEFKDITSENTQYIIPDYVNPGKTIKLGYPTVILDGDETKTVDTSDATIGTLTVSVTTPSGTTEVLTPSEGAFSYTIPTENAEGSYKVKYAYLYKATNQSIAKSYNFSVISTSQFDPEKDVTLKISSWSSSLDDLTLNVGVEKTLPTPTVVNSQKDETVSAYTVVDVEFYNTVTSSWVSEKKGITNFKFTPTKVGEYRFTYTCTDFYGSKAATRISSNIKATLSSSTLGIKLSNVAYDPTDPTFDREEFYKNTEDASYMVPTMVQVGSTVTLPAMVATAYGDFELSYTYTIAGNTRIYNALEEYTFSNTGTYTINYQVAYKDNTNQRVQRTFEVQVVQSLVKADVTLSGELKGLPVTVKAGDDLNFSVSATDIVTNTASSLYNQTADADVQKVVTATIGGAGVTVEKQDDGSYKIAVPSTTAANTVVHVKATLTDDLGKTIDVEKDITVVNYSADVVAPTLDKSAISEATGTFEFNRGDEVSVLPLTATDAGSPTAINVTVKNEGNTILDNSVFSLKDAGNNVAKIKADQFKFVLSNSGIYYITYEAIDSNNNITIFAYQIWSESNSTPGITLSGLQASANVGETIELSDVAKVSKDGEYVDYNTVLITDSSVDSSNIKTYITTNNIDTNSIIIKVQGEFKKGDTPTSIVARGDIDLTVWAYGDNADVDKRIDPTAFKQATITVSDTTKPEFTIAGQGESDRNIPLVDGKATINVDWFATADDSALGYEGKGVKTLSIKATYQSDSEEIWSVTKSVEDEIDDTELTFEATKNGRINVVYTVSDFANNEATTTLVYYVGDCVAPVVSLGDQDLTKTITTGGKFSLDLSQVKATDAGQEYEYGDGDMSFSIKLTQDGSDITSKAVTEDKIWSVSDLEAGTYVLTVTATDKAGNVSYAESKTFKVESKSSGKVTSTTVWGTILIILALVILAGVIFFFVRPTKGKVKVSNSTKKAEKKEEQPTE